MPVRIGTVIAIVLAVLWTTGSKAQTSSISLRPENLPPGETPPIPVMPIEIADSDYPLESLLAGDEGRVTLHLTIDIEGSVFASQIVMGSNNPRLDQAADRLARRWLFRPADKDGRKRTGSRDVDFIWKLPVRRADDVYSEMLGFPVAATTIGLARVDPQTHHARQGDYPVESLSRWEEGDVGLKILVAEDGRVGDVKTIESSGFPRLDQAASLLARNRFVFTPGSIDGKPTKMWVYELVSFTLSDKVARFCHSRPIIGGILSTAPKAPGDGLKVSQWLHVTADGTIDDVIVETARGWMRLSPGLVRTIALRSPAAQFEPPRAGTLFRGKGSRPASCWYNGEIAVQQG